MKKGKATKDSKDSESKPSKKDKKKPVEVNFNPDSSKGDLDNFNTKAKRLIKTSGEEGGDDQTAGFMKNLFVTEDDNAVMDQFEKEKQADIEGELGDKVNVPEVKRGWNEWAGAGVSDNKF